MAIEQSWGSTSALAGEDLSSKRFYACKFDSTGQAVACSVAGEPAVGVNLGEPASGEPTSLGVLGKHPVYLGGTVAANDKLTPNASGQLVKAYGSDAVIGIAMEAGVSGNIINALMIPQLVKPMGNIIALPINLNNISAADLLTSFCPGFAGRISKIDFIVGVIASTASKAASLNLEIGSVDLTGGVVALTTANCGTKGAVVAGSSITGNNTFDETDTISVEASSVTAFVEGSGVLMIHLE